MNYVYRYENEQGITVYVGITNNLVTRINQHKHDKLQYLQEPTIFYIPVKYRGDAELLETYLINYYKTGQHYNIAKTQKGDFSFLDICDLIPWNIYRDCVDDTIKPFVISQIIGRPREVSVTSIKYVNKQSINGAFRRRDDIVRLVTKELINEEKIVSMLTKLRSRNAHNEFLDIGIELHDMRKNLLGKLTYYPFCNADELLHEIERVNIKIEEHESRVC